MAKGERIIIENRQARLEGGDSGKVIANLGDFVSGINKCSVKGLEETPLPRNRIAWKIDICDFTLCILELEPALRRLDWINPDSPIDFGPEASYSPRKLATPFIVMKVPFRNGRILPTTELFYRNEPLNGLDNELFWPNLLNVSPNSYGCTSWICTQYLHSEPMKPGIAGGLHALLTHLWGGSFNRSSEMNEGKSGFSKAREDKIDKRVCDVIRWEKESIEDPKFILNVKWKSTGLTIRKLIEKELQGNRVIRDLGDTGELADVLISCRNDKSRRKKTGAA